MKFLVLDGNSILNRAYYGIKVLTTRDGIYTNGIYGFLTMLHRIEQDYQPDRVAVAFDLRGPTFRHKEYAGYKAKRKGMPEELAQQLPLLKELLEALGYTLVTCEGYEADDILGTFARVCAQSGCECMIATGDRDSLQLVGSGVQVRLASTKYGQPQVTVYDEARIQEEYGVTPRQLIDIKALMGDASDNIPGVAGIGKKGASDLIGAYGNIGYLYEHLDELEIKPAMYEKLKAGKESAFLSYRLGEIHTDAPVDTDLEHYKVEGGDKSKAAAMMVRLELFSLLKKLGLEETEPMENPQPAGQADPLPVRCCEDAKGLLAALSQEGCAYFLTEYGEGTIQKVYFYYNNTICILSVQHSPEAKECLREFFECEDIAKYTHDSKPLHGALGHMGISCHGMAMDTLLAAYLLNPAGNDYSLLRLMQEYQVENPGAQPLEGENQALLDALSGLPGLCRRLYEDLAKNQQEDLLKKMEIPLAGVLAQMERIGFAVDAQGIQAYGKVIEQRANELQALIHEGVGYEFNINSPKQLGEALFGKLGLPAGKKTKSGYSTNAEVLEKLRYEHPVAEQVLEYRGVAKLKSTYCDGLLKAIAPDGRIHSSFNQVETRTGRISSAEPNLQNIPVRTELGREMRRFFVAKEGHVLVDADYSQIELRVLAHVANDTEMIEAFRQGKDIHRATAAQIFHMPEEMVTPAMRSRAKAVNFGIVYGIGAFSLAKDLDVTRREAEAYINAYLDHYSGVRQYMEQVVEQAKELGYVETMFGRRRYLPELSASNFNLRSFGQRVARNMPIQGAAADIIKIAMVQVVSRLEEEQLQARLILQVHDELIVEAPQGEAAQVAMLLTDEMESAVSLAVPMVADSSMGKTWYDAKA